MEEEKIPQRSRKVLAFVPFIVAIIVLGGILAYVFYTDQSQLNTYQKQVQDLEKQVQDLKAKLNQESSSISSLEAQISEYKKEIQSYQNEIKNLKSNLGNSQYNVQQLQNKINALQAKIKKLNDILDLSYVDYVASGQIINLPAGGNYTWTIYPPYAGYVTVTIESSTTPKTYVEVIVNSPYGSWEKVEYVGSSGSCVFPVLPGTVQIIVGNYNLFQGATLTVSVEYHYRLPLTFSFQFTFSVNYTPLGR